MDLAAIGAAVRSARREKGITQEVLAARAGVSRATINGLETGVVRELGFHKVERILRTMDLHLTAAPASTSFLLGVVPQSSSRASSARIAPRRDLLRKLAHRYIWWERPADALRAPRRVIAQVMDAGTLEDIQRLAAMVGYPAMIDALSNARPGWFRPKSWAFWHAALGLSKRGTVPDLPARRTDVLPDPS